MEQNIKLIYWKKKYTKMEAKLNADTFAASCADTMHNIKVKWKIYRNKKTPFYMSCLI